MFPNCQRMNRGNYVISQLVHACTANNITDLIIVHEHRGEPGMLCNTVSIHVWLHQRVYSKTSVKFCHSVAMLCTVIW